MRLPRELRQGLSGASYCFVGLTNQANRPRADGAQAPPASGPVEREVRRQCAERVFRKSHLTRFQTSSAVPPVDAVAVFRKWSTVIVNGRFCSVPSQFGKKACSILKSMVLLTSLTEYVAQCGLAPCTAALFSSGVPSIRLFDANLGRPGRRSCKE